MMPAFGRWSISQQETEPCSWWRNPQRRREVKYTVVPFTANILKGQGANEAAEQLSQMINHYADQGLDYVRLESVSTIVTTPALAGCFGIGGTPATSLETVVYMVVFKSQ